MCLPCKVWLCDVSQLNKFAAPSAFVYTQLREAASGNVMLRR